ncbi:MAG: hypothetical protein ABIP07_06815 [Sphingomicrobium sp.]
MTYNLNPNLFVEQGAAVLLRRAQAARRSARAYELLSHSKTDHEPKPLDRAA